MDNKDFNEKIEKIANGNEFIIRGLEGTGKQIPYIGWFWRKIDFEKQNLPIGKIKDYKDEKGFVGFMANNKWFYPERMTTPEETHKIIKMLKDIVENPTQEKLQEFFDYFQSIGVANTCDFCGRPIEGKGFKINDTLGMSGEIYNFCNRECGDKFSEKYI